MEGSESHQAQTYDPNTVMKYRSIKKAVSVSVSDSRLPHVIRLRKSIHTLLPRLTAPKSTHLPGSNYPSQPRIVSTPHPNPLVGVLSRAPYMYLNGQSRSDGAYAALYVILGHVWM